MIRNCYSIFLLSLIIFGCSQKPLSKDELKAYALNEENGLYQASNSLDIKLEVLYRPSDLVADQNANSRQEFEEELQRLSDMDFFILKLSREGHEIENKYAGTDHYTQVTDYLNGGMSDDLWLEVDSQTIRPEAVIFVPSFGGSNGSSVLVTFKSNLKRVSHDFKLIFNDELLGVGRQEFAFKADAIRNCPALAYKN